ncbi:MAG: tRNA epoxyqueuosine(34) reductase QueG [Bacteroidales bacterium]|nr:MAG: tRNA epoxyqueuosine(34) reductase QueG [Bacteroidales bacterium]
MGSKQKLSEMIKSEAKKLGFDACGIAKAEYLKEEARHFKRWLNSKMHGDMKYMENYFHKRVDPTNLVKGAKSVIVVLLNYYTDKEQKDKNAPKISKYAYGKDYHLVIKGRLYQLLKFINNNINNINGRVFVDSAPVLERIWAVKAGLGWIGKNSNLISPVHGSYVFIGVLIIDSELHYDIQTNESCEACDKCITACPTGAIISSKVIDARKCISYLTIEHRGLIPEKYHEKFNSRIFGCDICQDICPWNTKSKKHKITEFEPDPELLKMGKNDWYNLKEEHFNRIFKGSAIERIGYSGLKRNIDFIRK